MHTYFDKRDKLSTDAVGCEKYGRTVKVMKRVPNFTPQRAININLNPKPKKMQYTNLKVLNRWFTLRHERTLNDEHKTWASVQLHHLWTSVLTPTEIELVSLQPNFISYSQAICPQAGSLGGGNTERKEKKTGSWGDGMWAAFDDHWRIVLKQNEPLLRGGREVSSKRPWTPPLSQLNYCNLTFQNNFTQIKLMPLVWTTS